MAASPSLSGSVAAIVTMAASTLAAILVPTAGVVSEVALAAPPPPIVAEEKRETELPASPGGGPPGSSLPPGPKEPKESVTGIESGRPMAVHADEVVDIPFDDEMDIMARPPMLSRELAVVQSKAGPSSALPEGDLEWAYPKDQMEA